MSFDENQALIRRFVDGVNQGNLDVIDETVSRDFFNYRPGAGEETAPAVIRQLGGDIIAAFPDLRIDIADFEDQGETITFSMTMSGALTGVLWGLPGTGNHSSWTSTVTCRFSEGKFAFCWKDLSVPEVMATFRAIGLVPPPEDMDKPTKHPVSIPEFLLKLIFTGQVADLTCSHLDLIQVTEPESDVCNECIAQGDLWPALRLCLICGYIGCCDTSKNKHMKKHFGETGHPIFRSIRLQESWVWCYEDDRFFSGKILDNYR